MSYIMNRIWPNQSTYREPEEQPVLGKNRNRIITYERQIALKIKN